MNLMQELETSQCLSPCSALIDPHGSHFTPINFKLVFLPGSPLIPPSSPFSQSHLRFFISMSSYNLKRSIMWNFILKFYHRESGESSVGYASIYTVSLSLDHRALTYHWQENRDPPLGNIEDMYKKQVKRQENALSPIVPIDPKETLLYATQ